MSLDIDNRLLPTKSLRSEYAHSRHDVSVKPGVTLAHCIEPKFWAHLAARFRVHDVIEVIAEDGSFEMDLRVMAIVQPRPGEDGDSWVKVRAIRFCGPDGVGIFDQIISAVDADSPDEDGYQIRFHGRAKFSIHRFGDSVEEGISTKEAAFARLAEIRREKLAA
jgi:hypothetical protein